MEVAAPTRPYRQRARAQASERTRQALLEAAEREFFLGSWAHASLESIAGAAGVTKQTLLRHFGAKDALLREVMLRSQGTVREERWAAPRGDIAGAIDNLLDHYERWGEPALRTVAESSPRSALARASCTTTGSSTRLARGSTCARRRPRAAARR